MKAKKLSEPVLTNPTFRIGDKLDGPGGQRVEIIGFGTSSSYYGADPIFFDKCNQCLLLVLKEGSGEVTRRAWLLANKWNIIERGTGREVPVIPIIDFSKYINGPSEHEVAKVPEKLKKRPMTLKECIKIVKPSEEDTGQLKLF